MRHRNPRPDQLAQSHRRDWRRLWRYCRCGLRWPCLDRNSPAPGEPRVIGTATPPLPAWAAAPTANYGPMLLTRGQQLGYRATRRNGYRG
jgi:hypothetical protein